MVWTGEGEKPAETPIKKYQRLNCEVRELLDEIKASAGDGGNLDRISLELEQLHSQLVRLRLDEVTGEAGHVIRGGDLSSARLLQQLKQIQVIIHINLHIRCVLILPSHEKYEH